MSSSSLTTTLILLSFILLQLQVPCLEAATLSSPIKKDATTNLYTMLIYLKTPLQPSQLHIDLGFYLPWYDCARHYKSSSYQPLMYNSSLCLDLGTKVYGNCFNKPGPGCSNDTCSFFPENPVTGKGGMGQILTDRFALPTAKNPAQLGPVSQIVLSCTFPNKYSRIYRDAERQRSAFERQRRLLAIDENGLGGTKLSTSKPYTVLQSSIFKALTDAFVKESDALNLTRVNPVAPFSVCYAADKISRTRVGPAVPAIDLVLGKDNVLWRIYGSNSMVRMKNEWCLGFVDGGADPKTSIVEDISGRTIWCSLTWSVRDWDLVHHFYCGAQRAPILTSKPIDLEYKFITLII
ncbi:UNVERIFIED_CONTAM: putative aspartic proteinase GIP2 [Sesamum radiatum]|uniref:Aspartic proteinase GIP2 n=1 Tax=Sesamum radiatum TaxID=300843 RepID=A0AAW2URV8_SESRA